MQAAVDPELIRGVGIAFETGQALVHQRRRQRPGGIVQPRGIAEVQHPQLLDARCALLANHLTTAQHVDTHVHL
ncbi:hypothetical protein D3C76_1410370 [compost metagenome]